MDVQMPEMDGFEATARIRRNKEKSTGQPHPHHRPDRPRHGGRPRTCLAAGMDDYVSKPINADRFVRGYRTTRCPPRKPQLGTENQA